MPLYNYNKSVLNLAVRAGVVVANNSQLRLGRCLKLVVHVDRLVLYPTFP